MASEFLPIEAYGVIGNDNRCALVGRNGSIDWFPLPHLESPSVFAAILDPDGGGRFAIAPSGPYEATQTYVDRTNVLKTTFDTADGTATVIDFLPVRERTARPTAGSDAARDEPGGEPPDERFQQALYRKVVVSEGTVELDVSFEPRFEYGRLTPALDRFEGDAGVVARTDVGPDGGDVRDGEPGGDGSLRADSTSSAATESGDGHPESLYLHSSVDIDIDADAGRATGSTRLEAESVRWFCCQYGVPSHRSTAEYQSILEGTVEYWRSWHDGCETDGLDFGSLDDRWQDVLTRSTLVLKLLIHEETGAIPAAATTSLPEAIGGSLNWDYRYNWIRDAKLTVQALYSVGQEREARQYFQWFRAIGHTDPAEIKPLYDLHGTEDIDERTLDHLQGYRGSTPVRVGNAAADQRQLDIYGTIVEGISETVRLENGLTDADWESIRALANYVCDHWTERGESIWEFRSLHEHFVHSKLLCWVALDRALRMADAYDRDGPVERWRRERATIREAIETRGYDDAAGTFRQFFDADDAVDATALLIPLYGFLPADDERVRGTIETVEEELTTEDGLVVRFANSPARPRESGGFVICTCWLVDALVLAGRVETAREYFESLLEYASPLGLYAEMIHTDDGTFLGNYPQAFSHIGLINSAVHLASAEDDHDETVPAQTDGDWRPPGFGGPDPGIEE